MSGKSVEFRRRLIYGGTTGQPGGKGWVRLSPRGVQEGQEVDPAQPPAQVRASGHEKTRPPNRISQWPLTVRNATCGCVHPARPGAAPGELIAPVLTDPGRNSCLACRRNGRFPGSSGGKRRPEPHGHGSFRPSFSRSSVSMPTMRSPRLTRDSLEGTPGGACWRAQKDASASW